MSHFAIKVSDLYNKCFLLEIYNWAFLESTEIKEEDLFSHFSQCGEIQEVIIVSNQRKLVTKKGYGFITFKVCTCASGYCV